jgi:hypothetical protein
MTLKEIICEAIDKAGLGELANPATMAAVFCEWDDQKQAQFFVEVARNMQTWTSSADPIGTQGYHIGGHLRTCSCATYEARELVRSIAASVGER